VVHCQSGNREMQGLVPNHLIPTKLNKKTPGVLNLKTQSLLFDHLPIIISVIISLDWKTYIAMHSIHTSQQC